MEITKCFKFRTRRPLYLISTSKECTLRRVNSEIKFVNHTKITWERRHSNPKVIIQCHRCQKWGHATSNCRLPRKCLKCAKCHMTKDCTKSQKLPPKCANCLKEHTTNNTQCEKYQTILRNSRNQNQNIERRQYEPAPPPTKSAWKPTTYEQQFPSLTPVKRTPPQTKESSETTTEINQLAQQMKELNNLINVSAMLTAISDLNSKLKNCNNKIEQFTTFHNFLSNLDHYGFQTKFRDLEHKRYFKQETLFNTIFRRT